MAYEDSRTIINNSPFFDSDQKKTIRKALKELGGIVSSSFFSIGKDFPTVAISDLRYVYIPTDCTLISVGIINTSPGTLFYDIWRSSSGDFNPPIFPGPMQSIVGFTPPAVVGGVFYQDTFLEGWQTSFNSGDVLALHVDAVDEEFDSIIVLGLEQRID